MIDIRMSSIDNKYIEEAILLINRTIKSNDMRQLIKYLPLTNSNNNESSPIIQQTIINNNSSSSSSVGSSNNNNYGLLEINIYQMLYHFMSTFFINYHFIYTNKYVLLLLVLVLAASGTSLGIREMYVRALLKLFQYATNIKNEKLKEIVDEIDDTNDEFEKRQHIARLKRLRRESFKLRSASDDGGKSSDDDYHDQNCTTNNNESTTNKDNNDNEIKKSSSDKQISSLSKREFHLGDAIDFLNKGIDSIIDDTVTKRFTTEELTVWNLLTRTNQQYEYVSFRVTVLWLLGFLLRYFVLFPFRLLLFVFACGYTMVITYVIGMIPNGKFKLRLNHYMIMILHRILSRVFSAIITFHNKENRAKYGTICVANHTSPIDVIILSTDNTYSLIGQRHSGFTGMMQEAFSRASKHIWFDRSESKDRSFVSRRMREHVLGGSKSCPLLIFPEGTCINNTSVMMFKKGCFEIDEATIHPVAIKYDSRFGDAFWNSSKHTMLQYLILMMTSWAIVVDVYYLPPMKREPNEDVLQFTNRVKAEIVKKGSFVDLNWDGMLKRTTPKLDLMYEQQQDYVRTLKLD